MENLWVMERGARRGVYGAPAGRPRARPRARRRPKPSKALRPPRVTPRPERYVESSLFRDVRSNLVVRDVSRFGGGSQVGMELRRQRPGFGELPAKGRDHRRML